jgi:hypothetical protein
MSEDIKRIHELVEALQASNPFSPEFTELQKLIDVTIPIQQDTPKYTTIEYSSEHLTQLRSDHLATRPVIRDPLLTFHGKPVHTCPDCGRDHDILILSAAKDLEHTIAWCPCGTVSVRDETRPGDISPCHPVYSFYNHHHRTPENGPTDYYSPNKDKSDA